jgi:hypothetical protein
LDPVETLVRAIHAELEKVHGSKVRLAIGRLEANKHDRYPRVAWIEQGGRFEMVPSHADGIEVPAAVIAQRPNLLVKCWGKDVEDARALAFHTVLACSRVQQSRAQWERDYDVPDEHHETAGTLLTMSVYLTLEVPIDTEFTRKVVTIQDTEHELSVNDEQVC